MDYFDETFDLSFPQMRWLPWVGDKYRASGIKLIILGESHYDWEDPADSASSSKKMLNDKNFTRGIVVGHGLGLSSKWKMHRNLERVVFNEKSPSKDKQEMLWRSVCYHNLVLKEMPGLRQRPTWSDYEKGWEVFFDLVDILEPTHCLFAGTDPMKLSAFDKVASTRNAELSGKCIEKIGRANGRKFDVKTVNSSFSIVFIKHPSRFFPWKQWYPFVHRFIPNPVE